MAPIERRGRQEIATWAGGVGVVALILLADLLKTGQLDERLVGLFVGLVAAFMTRSTERAGQRSAQEELMAKRESDARLLEQAAVSAAKRAEDAARRAEEAGKD